ncbi:MAG: DegT/DnrJ/EryC1/StrS family aminotransferase [Candidatus Zixiibacteriota bacterium]
MPKRQSPDPISLFDLSVTTDASRRVLSVLKRGWLSTGPIAREFEIAIGKQLKVANCVAVSSATSGLQLALMASDVAGKEVITTSLTMVATVEAILLAGGKPRFADIDPTTLTIDPLSVARLCNKQTAAIVSVDLAGNPVDYSRLRKITRDAKVRFISDAAHSFAAKVGASSVAVLCDFSVFSFYATKNLTCAEGGMVVSKSKSASDQIRLMSRHGMTTNADDRRRNRRWKYDVPYFGIKANLSDVHAAIGLGMLTRFDADQNHRRLCAERYARNLSSLSEWIRLPQERPGTTHGWHLFIVQLQTNRLTVSRDAVIDKMAKCGIECGLHYRPIYELSWYKKHMAIDRKALPNTIAAEQRIMSLPLHPRLTMKDIDRVCETLADIVKRHRR